MRFIEVKVTATILEVAPYYMECIPVREGPSKRVLAWCVHEPHGAEEDARQAGKECCEENPTGSHRGTPG